jgi:hypothetical protein
MLSASLAFQPALDFDKTARLIAGPENSLTMNQKIVMSEKQHSTSFVLLL